MKNTLARKTRLAAFSMAMMFSGFVMAADLTGTWILDVQTSMGPGKATFKLQQEGDGLTGTYTGTLGTADLEGNVSGDNFEWSYSLQNLGEVRYTGMLLEDGTVKGDADYGDALGKATFTGKRQ